MRVRRREMEAIFGLDEALEGGGWFIARNYRTHNGVIYPDGPFKELTPNLLADASAFLSFARLSARGQPSEDVILAWAREHGLFGRLEPDNPHPILESGTVNQEPLPVADFREASGFASRLLRLYELWRSGDAETLRSRMKSRPIHPPGEPERAKFADVLLDGERTPYVVGVDDPLTDETILDATRRTVQVNVQANLIRVHPVFAADGRLVLRCPDLLSGMFYSFAKLVSGERAAALCEGCGKVFEKRRRDQKSCDSTCRSRKSRAG